MPKISVIICTRNRADSLRLTLDSIGNVSVPMGWNVELVVVDNGSTDQTRSVVNEMRPSNMLLRYVAEPMAGLSYARNTGIDITSGEILLFTDDDVRVPIEWIEGMCTPILQGSGDAVAGGVVFPAQYESLLSGPLKHRMGWLASTANINPLCPERMVGANMAFHRRVVESGLTFDVELGAGALGFGDETLFSWQLLALGYSLIGALDVAVVHYFDITRLNRVGLLSMARKMGHSHAFLFHHWHKQRSRLIIPRLALCHATRCFAGLFDRVSKPTVFEVSEQLLQVEQEMAFCREYMVQRCRPSKYQSFRPLLESRGLRRLGKPHDDAEALSMTTDARSNKAR